MPTSAELPELCPLDELRARLTPGALLFALADAEQALALRTELRQPGLAWVGWSQRQRFLQAWRPSAQERYSSMAGREAPSLRDWLRPQFKRWVEGPQGISALQPNDAAAERALALCGLASLAGLPVSLLSNGESARACLGAALAQGPSLLVLQDLAEGLDSAGRKMLLDLGHALAAEGRALLFLASRPSLFPTALPGAMEPEFERAAAPAGPEIFACEALDLQAGSRPLIRGLSWRVSGGEAWWLRGDNGRGKSTLLAYLSGEHPQAWAKSWRLAGRGREAYTPLSQLRSQVAWVSPELAAVSGEPILSLLGKALAGPAKLLLLDEALRGLDEQALVFWHQRLAAWLGPEKAFVFVCHDPAEAPACLNQSLELP